MSKKKKKYQCWIGDDSYDAICIEDPDPMREYFEKNLRANQTDIPQKMRLGSGSGFRFWH